MAHRFCCSVAVLLMGFLAGAAAFAGGAVPSTATGGGGCEVSALAATAFSRPTDSGVRALSTTVADVPDVAGVNQLPPPQQQAIVVNGTVHLASQDKKLYIGIIICGMIQLSVWFGVGVHKSLSL